MQDIFICLQIGWQTHAHSTVGLHYACCIVFQGQTFLSGLFQFLTNKKEFKELSGVFALLPFLVCFCEKKKKKIKQMCQLGFRMDDLVDYLLSVIISNTESHKKCCWHQRRMHPDTHLQGSIKSCKCSQSYTSNNRMRHKNSLRQQYKCTCDLWHVEHVCSLFTSSTGTPLILL